MTWPIRFLIPIVVAGTVPATAIVAAQQEAQKAAAPPVDAVKAEPRTTVTVEKVEVQKAEVQKVEVKRKANNAAVQVRRAVAPQQNLEPMIQNFVTQLTPMLRAEVHLVLTACSPTKEQRAALAAEQDRILKDVARQCVEAQMGQRQVNVGLPNPLKLIAEGMAATVREKLSPEQAARYKAESEAKIEVFKRVAVSNLVANIDEELLLSDDQRGRLTLALASGWDESWCSGLQSLMNGGQYLPMIPDKIVDPILDPTQKRAWDKRQKFQNVFWGNFNFMGNAAIEEPADPPAGPKKPEAKP